jgi:hypothetical protein
MNNTALVKICGALDEAPAELRKFATKWATVIEIELVLDGM